MKCEKCNIEHSGEFGSGRFCSRKCANSIGGLRSKGSIKLWKEENKKSSSWYGKEVKCANCGKIFILKRRNKPDRIYCSRKCILDNNPDYIKKLSISLIKAHQDGKMRGSKRSIRCEYNFNGSKIRCDSKVEYAGIDFFISNFDVKEIKRCNFSIEYEYKNKIKRYLPDFIVITKDKTYIVECKAFFKITSEVTKSKSWSMYYDTIEIKRKKLQQYCKDNGFIEFLFRKEMHLKFYNTCKVK